jgi:hypothetical protein
MLIFKNGVHNLVFHFVKKSDSFCSHHQKNKLRLKGLVYMLRLHCRLTDV